MVGRVAINVHQCFGEVRCWCHECSIFKRCVLRRESQKTKGTGQQGDVRSEEQQGATEGGGEAGRWGREHRRRFYIFSGDDFASATDALLEAHEIKRCLVQRRTRDKRNA